VRCIKFRFSASGKRSLTDSQILGRCLHRALLLRRAANGQCFAWVFIPTKDSGRPTSEAIDCAPPANDNRPFS